MDSALGAAKIPARLVATPLTIDDLDCFLLIREGEELGGKFGGAAFAAEGTVEEILISGAEEGIREVVLLSEVS